MSSGLGILSQALYSAALSLRFLLHRALAGSGGVGSTEALGAGILTTSPPPPARQLSHHRHPL